MKVQIFKLAIAGSKIHQILISYLEPRVSFSSNYASLFGVKRHDSFVLLHLNLYMLWIKGAHENANFQKFSTAIIKINQMPYIIFQATGKFCFKFCITVKCHDT